MPPAGIENSAPVAKIDGVTKPEQPLEAPVAALHEVIVLLLLLPLGLFLALQGEHAVAERDADVLLIHAGKNGHGFQRSLADHKASLNER